MTEETIPKAKVNAFERHAQTALVLLLVALLLWVGKTTQNTAVSVAEMRVELSYMKGTIADPPERDVGLAKRIVILEERLHLFELKFNALQENQQE